jgi:hypothetical protein
MSIWAMIFSSLLRRFWKNIFPFSVTLRLAKGEHTLDPRRAMVSYTYLSFFSIPACAPWRAEGGADQRLAALVCAHTRKTPADVMWLKGLGVIVAFVSVTGLGTQCVGGAIVGVLR